MLSKRKTTIVTECGHQYNTWYSPNILRNCTTDCRVCGQLLIFPSDIADLPVHVVRAVLFHKYLNEQWSEWPADGNNCYSVGF